MGALVAVLIIVLFMLFVGASFAYLEGWSPIEAYRRWQENSLEIKHDKRMKALEFKLKEAELEAKRAAIQEEAWRKML